MRSGRARRMRRLPSERLTDVDDVLVFPRSFGARRASETRVEVRGWLLLPS